MALPKRLLDGYANFRKGRYASESERYLKLGEGLQKPTIMMIACCDSRAAPETMFDAAPRNVVVRNVAILFHPISGWWAPCDKCRAGVCGSVDRR